METANFLELKWGTPTYLKYNDPKYGEIDFRIYGICLCEVTNNANVSDFQEQFTSFILPCIKDIISKQKDVSFEDIPKSLQELLPAALISLGVKVKELKVQGYILSDQTQKNIAQIKRNTVTVVKTDEEAKDGQNKCPKCGATDISLNVKTGKLRCQYCRNEFENEKVVGLETDISKLQGQVMGSGATDIVADTNDVVTFKCSSCGAEVVIDTAESTQARCHWCRHTLSINQQIPNGSIPDVVLPFSISKDVAKAEIEKFVGKRKFFANPKFKSEFTTNNIMGVYFPYMLVDINAHGNFSGEGEHLVRRYTRRNGNTTTTYYDADLYYIEREYDLVVEGLSVESSKDKLNNNASDKTNNVINAIMPFDTENCVKWNANYLKGYTSEKRDTNIGDLKNIVDTQTKDVARFSTNETLKEYDRGVLWSNEQLDIIGEQWKSAYLPVWLYSYQEVKGNKKILHYVAVNARTKETMGSIPLHMPKLLFMSFLVEILGVLGIVIVDFDYDWTFLSAGIIYFIIMFSKYRNAGARHKYETETKTKMTNLRKVDRFIKSKKGLTNSKMTGANNTKVNGQNSTNQIFEAMTGENLGNKAVDAITNSSPIASFIKDNIDKKGGN